MADKKARTETTRIISHTWADSLVDGLFVDAGDGFLVTSPECSFLQAAGQMSITQLIQFGYELCATYAIEPNNGSLIQRKAVLTTVERLEAFVAKTGGAYGKKKATRALRYITNGSASPMERRLS